MKKNKLFILFTILAVFALFLAACGDTDTTEEGSGEGEVVEQPETGEEEPAEPVTVDVWFHSGKGEERDVLDAQVTAFNEMQDEIFINAIQLPEGSL